MVDLFDNALKIIESNIVNFFIMFVLFIIIFFIIYGIFTIIISLTIGLFFRSLLPGFQTALSLIILTWYISSLGEMSKSILNNKTVDYVNAIIKGLYNLKINFSPVLIIAILGFIGGFIEQLTFGNGFLGYGLFNFSVIQGIFYLIAIGIALSEFVGKKNGINFTHLFNKINKISPNAGISLYIIVLISIIPIGEVLQILIMGFPVIIIILFEMESHSHNISHNKQNEKKQKNM
ncbi:MAG: hypothetical protein QXD23_01230 [Candidatus Micrarchaeaceae archaeon]